jgi:hypothetical protein
MVKKIFRHLLIGQVLIITLQLMVPINTALAAVSAVLDSSSAQVSVPEVKYIMRQEMRPDRSVLIGWEEAYSEGTFIIRNETGEYGRSLSNRPDRLDVRVLNIIVKEHIKSVEDYAVWLRLNIAYRLHEGEDIWTEPGVTIDRRHGDCKDISLLNMAFLRVFGYKPIIFAMARLYDSHAICVFKKEGRYFWFDNTRLVETPATSFEEFNEYVLKFHRMYFLYEVDVTKVFDKQAS